MHYSFTHLDNDLFYLIDIQLLMTKDKNKPYSATDFGMLIPFANNISPLWNK